MHAGLPSGGPAFFMGSFVQEAPQDPRPTTPDAVYRTVLNRGGDVSYPK